jgi:hypothetical protein
MTSSYRSTTPNTAFTELPYGNANLFTEVYRDRFSWH